MIWTLLFIICVTLNIMSGAFSYSFGTPTP